MRLNGCDLLQGDGIEGQVTRFRVITKGTDAVRAAPGDNVVIDADIANELTEILEAALAIGTAAVDIAERVAAITERSCGITVVPDTFPDDWTTD